MFNPEKILGGMLRSSPRGGMFGKSSKGAIGLGLLGVAVAAVEHFMEKSSATQRRGMSSLPPGSTTQGSGPAVPPAPPSGRAAPVSPPPPPAPATSTFHGSAGEAVLLIRAMIAAAHADGKIDQNERAQILEKFKAVEMTPEEHVFIVNELLSPCSQEAILRAVTTPEMARQVYAVSLMAIEVDTEAERDYIRQLAQGLGLEPSTRQEIQRELGIQEI